jgi:hypothetical protein
VGGEGQAEEDDDEGGQQEQRGGVVGQALGEAHEPIGGAAGADHDHQAEHQQGVGEHGADDGRLGHHQLGLFEREDDDEQLGEVAERGLEHAGEARSEALAELLGGERHDPREPGQREGGEGEARHGSPAAVVGEARERREHRDQQQEQALGCSQAGHRTIATIACGCDGPAGRAGGPRPGGNPIRPSRRAHPSG